MATVHLEDAIYRAVESRAQQRGSSVDAQVNAILAEHMAGTISDGERRRNSLLALISKLKSQPLHWPEGMTSVEYLRQMRAEEVTSLSRPASGDA